VYRRDGSDPFDEKFLCKTEKHTDSLMVRACFSDHGVSDLVV